MPELSHFFSLLQNMRERVDRKATGLCVERRRMEAIYKHDGVEGVNGFMGKWVSTERFLGGAKDGFMGDSAEGQNGGWVIFRPYSPTP